MNIVTNIVWVILIYFVLAGFTASVFFYNIKKDYNNLNDSMKTFKIEFNPLMKDSLIMGILWPIVCIYCLLSWIISLTTKKSEKKI